MIKPFFICLFMLYGARLVAQPFVDLLTFSSQNFFSEYSDSSKNPLYVQNNFLNVFIPKKFGKEHVLLIRLNSEKLLISRKGSPGWSQQVYSISLPLGLLITSPNKKWKYTGIVIPKVNSDFKDDLAQDFQLGGIGLVTRVFSENLQVRAGIYYNREFFGNFLWPLVGVDWKVNERLQMYGTMPSNYRIEFKLNENWNTGLGFRASQRSFRLSGAHGNDFIWIRESQIKLYVEGFVVKNLVFTFDVYRSLGYRMPRSDYANVRQEKEGLPALQPFKDNFGFTLGFSYRILTRPAKVLEKS